MSLAATLRHTTRPSGTSLAQLSATSRLTWAVFTTSARLEAEPAPVLEVYCPQQDLRPTDLAKAPLMRPVRRSDHTRLGFTHQLLGADILRACVLPAALTGYVLSTLAHFTPQGRRNGGPRSPEDALALVQWHSYRAVLCSLLDLNMAICCPRNVLCLSHRPYIAACSS